MSFPNCTKPPNKLKTLMYQTYKGWDVIYCWKRKPPQRVKQYQICLGCMATSPFQNTSRSSLPLEHHKLDICTKTPRDIHGLDLRNSVRINAQLQCANGKKKSGKDWFSGETYRRRNISYFLSATSSTQPRWSSHIAIRSSKMHFKSHVIWPFGITFHNLVLSRCLWLPFLLSP